MANEKILVVDDDQNICELLRLYLTKEGYQVTLAADGEDALAKYGQVKPDWTAGRSAAASARRGTPPSSC